MATHRAQYSVLRTCQVRAGFELSSERRGVLQAGQQVEALEQREIEGGGVRVRIDRGWVSVKTKGGVAVLELAEAPSDPAGIPDELKDESACDPQQIADDALVSMVETIDRAAETEVGKKQVGAMSRPFMGREVASLSRQRRNAAQALRSIPDDAAHEEQRDELKRINGNLRRAITKEKRAAQGRLFREIEGTGSDRILFGRWKARVRALSSAGNLPEVVQDGDGQLLTDPVAVLRAWRNFYERLGKEDVIGDIGDRAEQEESRFDDDFARQVLEGLRARALDGNGEIPELGEQISWAEVHSVVRGCASNGL